MRIGAAPRTFAAWVLLAAFLEAAADPAAAAASFRAQGAASVRTIRVNLDEDREREAIVVASWKGNRQPPRAIVFDRRSNGWHAVAEFDGGVHWAGKGAGRFVELRSTVSHRRKDLIVREARGGTGFLATGLSIHRMRDSELRAVFSAAESRQERAEEAPDTILESATFGFRPPRIVERRREIHEPDIPAGPEPPAPIDTCTVFQWSEPAFRFVPDSISTRRLCPPPR